MTVLAQYLHISVLMGGCYEKQIRPEGQQAKCLAKWVHTKAPQNVL